MKGRIIRIRPFLFFYLIFFCTNPFEFQSIYISLQYKYQKTYQNVFSCECLKDIFDLF